MPSQRTFYRTVLQVEVLSEEAFRWEDLDDVAFQIATGDCSGDVTTLVYNEGVDGPRMAKLLAAQRSDPGFFRLTADGEDADEDDGEAVGAPADAS